jgi:hypothetical protein
VVYVTRHADPKATGYFSIKARNETEHQLIGDLKRLSRQDDIELADLVFEGLQYLFKAHHWPPGNPQLQLAMFQNEQPPSKTESNLCECGQTLEMMYRLWQDKTLYKSCKRCFNTIHSYKIQVYGPIQKRTNKPKPPM